MTGKFYYRPPGGESWTDVVLRIRQFLAELRQGHGDRRVWIFTHQAVIMSFRFVLERLDESRAPRDRPFGGPAQLLLHALHP